MSFSGLTRRLAALALGVSVWTTALPLSASAASFADVPSGAWYRSYVLRLADQGILNGTGYGQFSPNATLTRAAFITMLVRSYLTADQLADYRFSGDFRDVPANHYANASINWAKENGVVSGVTPLTFAPDRAVTRQEMAVMAVNFADTVGRHIPEKEAPAPYTDEKALASWAKEPVSRFQRAGILTGYKDGSFRPKGSATRAEAAAVVDRFLQSTSFSPDCTLLARRINGLPLKAVIFDPTRYEADLLTGRDVVDGGEKATSMIDRTGADIALNAAFFNMSNYQALGTLIRDGEVLTTFETFSPAKSALTLDADGRWSVQQFSTRFSAELFPQEPLTGESTPSDETPPEESRLPQRLENLLVNRWPSSETDATRILFTRAWGHDLAFDAKDAVTISPEGVILSVDHDKNVPIPEGCVVLAQRARRRYEGTFFDSCRVGDTLRIERTLEGLTGGDPVLSVGAGPQLVKDGAVYGDLSTYQAEGFTDRNITTYSAQRIAVGVRPGGQLVLVTAQATLPELSRALVALGCREAINFDGGGSSNLYADGFWLIGPQSRKLNTLLFFRKK